MNDQIRQKQLTGTILIPLYFLFPMPCRDGGINVDEDV